MVGAKHAKPANRAWTDEDDKTVRAMLKKGHSASQIGAVVGRTRNSVISRIHRVMVDIAPDDRPKPIGRKVNKSYVLSQEEVAQRRADSIRRKRQQRQQRAMIRREEREAAEKLAKAEKGDYVPKPPPGWQPRSMVTLMALEPWECRWPHGDVPPYLFCAAVKADFRYCEEHVKASLPPGWDPAKERRKYLKMRGAERTFRL